MQLHVENTIHCQNIFGEKKRKEEKVRAMDTSS